jgi:antitoxin CptB
VAGDAADAVRARLAWRCRRGTKELDLLLQRWLRAAWPSADAASRALFETLLALPDPELADYLLGGARPTRADLAALVQAIRALPPLP